MRGYRILSLVIGLLLIIGISAYGVAIYRLDVNRESNRLAKLETLNKKETPVESATETKAVTEIGADPNEYIEGDGITPLEGREVVPVDAHETIRVNPSTRMIFQDYYLLDDTIESSESEPAYNVINMTREELEKYYDEWQILKFDSEKVILRRGIEKKNPDGYFIIREVNGKIGVYKDYTEALATSFSEAYRPLEYTDDDYKSFILQFLEENKEEYLKEVIDIPVTILPEEDAYRIKEGILVYSEEELIKLLENYTS